MGVMVIGSFSVSVFADDGTGSAETSVSEDSSAVEAAPVSGDTGSSGGDVVVNGEPEPEQEPAAAEPGSEVSVLDVTPAIARAVAEVTLSLTTLALVI